MWNKIIVIQVVLHRLLSFTHTNWSFAIYSAIFAFLFLHIRAGCQLHNLNSMMRQRLLLQNSGRVWPWSLQRPSQNLSLRSLARLIFLKSQKRSCNIIAAAFIASTVKMSTSSLIITVFPGRIGFINWHWPRLVWGLQRVWRGCGVRGVALGEWCLVVCLGCGRICYCLQDLMVI